MTGTLNDRSKCVVDRTSIPSLSHIFVRFRTYPSALPSLHFMFLILRSMPCKLPCATSYWTSRLPNNSTLEMHGIVAWHRQATLSDMVLVRLRPVHIWIERTTCHE